MANFVVNFQANTTGDHYVGYRTYNDPVNTYTVETLNVVSTGPQSVQIDIPGNLYCGDITYEGYIIAACEVQDDNNSDGIPDNATTFTVDLLKQTDPCISAEITCDNSPIASVTVTNGGTGGYTVGDSITVTEANPGDELVAAVLEVGAETGGVIDSINIVNAGSYKAAPVLTAATGNADAVLDAVMQDCATLDIRDYQCNGDNTDPDDPIYVLKLGELMALCVDTTTLAGLSSRFTSTTDTQCRCRECKRYEIVNSAGVDQIASIQTCWDGSHATGSNVVTVTYTILAGQTLDVGCCMIDTVVLQDSATMSINTFDC